MTTNKSINHVQPYRLLSTEPMSKIVFNLLLFLWQLFKLHSLIPIFLRIPARRRYATFTRWNHSHFFVILFVLTQLDSNILSRTVYLWTRLPSGCFLITTSLTSWSLGSIVIYPICSHKLHFCFSRPYINLRFIK